MSVDKRLSEWIAELVQFFRELDRQCNTDNLQSTPKEYCKLNGGDKQLNSIQ